MLINDKKQCRNCLEEKAFSDFYHSAQLSGLSPLCRVCIIARNKRRYEAKMVARGLANLAAIPPEIASLRWKAIPNFDCYEVSECGHARKGRFARMERFMLLRPDIDKDGYHIYTLSHNGSPVKIKAHRAVLLAFIGEPPKDKPLACHKDGTRDNNNLDNLYWGSLKDNYEDSRRHGTAWLHGRKKRELVEACQ